VLCKRSGPVRSGPNPAGPRASPVHGLPGPRVGTVRVTPVQFGEERPRPVSNPSGSDPHGLARSGPGLVRSGPGLVQVFFFFSFKSVKLFKPDSKLNLEKMATWIFVFFISN